MARLGSRRTSDDGSILLWPFLMLVATITLQNIYLVYTPKFGPGLNYINITLVVCIAAALARRDRSNKPPLCLTKPIIALFASYFFGWFVSVTRFGFIEGSSLASIKDIFIGVIFYFLAVGLIKSKADWNRVLVASMIPLLYMFRVFHNQLQSVFRWHYDDDMRTVSGTFMELGSNEIGAFYAYVSLVLLALLLFVKPIKYRVGIGIALVLTLYGVLYSFSRGSYLAFFAGALILVWFKSKKAAIALLFSLIVATSVFKGLLPVSVQERIDSIFVEEEHRDKSAQSRIVIWGYAMEEFSHSPIWGIGYGAFKHTGPTGQDTHNYFVKILTEHGVIGILILLWLIKRMFQLIRRAMTLQADPAYQGMALGVAAAGVSLIVSNMFGDRFTHYPLIAFFWLYLGMLEAGIRFSQKSDGMSAQKL